MKETLEQIRREALDALAGAADAQALDALAQAQARLDALPEPDPDFAGLTAQQAQDHQGDDDVLDDLFYFLLLMSLFLFLISLSHSKILYVHILNHLVILFL